MSQPREQYVDIIDEDFVPRRQMDEVQIDITPMIDITFLLLIFFIVASKLDEGAAVELPQAKHGTAVAMKNSAVITMTQNGDTALIYLGEGRADETLIKSTDPTEQEEAIIRYLEEQQKAGKTEVIVMAERSVKHGEVARVSKAVGKAGFTNFYVAVLEEQ